MAFPTSPNYTALKTEILKPAYNGMTDVQIASTIDATPAVASAQPALLTPNAVFNAITVSDFIGLTQIQQSQLANLMSISNSGLIDGSPGTLVRAWFSSVFNGKTSLANLTALVSPFDNATVPFYATFGWSSPIVAADVTYARANG